MRITRWVVGPLRTNCYVVESRGEVLIIDPGWHEDLEDLLRYISEKSLDVKSVIATHGHFDHVAGVSVIKRVYNTRFLINERDLLIAARAPEIARLYLGLEIPEIPRPDSFISEGDEMRVGDVSMRVLEVPGHSPGSVALYIERASDTGRPVLFSGDTLFRDSIGRTDIPGASPDRMRESLRRIASLPLETIVLPGHGSATTLGREIERNLYLRQILGLES